MIGNIDTIIVKIKKEIFVGDNNFKIFATELKHSNFGRFTSEVVVLGHFLVANPGDEIEMTGMWEERRGTGNLQFRANSYNVKEPATTEAMYDYLRRSVEGIGKKKAEAIVEHFKEDTMDIIKNDWTRLSEVPGIGDKTAYNIYQSVVGNKVFEELTMFLLPLGVRHKDIVDVYSELGSGAINIIRANPYELYRLTKLKFPTIDKMAHSLGFKHNSKERIIAGIQYYINIRMNNYGDLFVFRDDLLKSLPNIMFYLGRDSFKDNEKILEEEIEKALDEMLEIKILVEEKNNDGENCIYIKYYNYVENSIVNKIEELISNGISRRFNDKNIEDTIKKYEKKTKMKLASKQRDAVRMALSNKISILSGGPGTGKTQTINAIIHAIKNLSPLSEISLAAPTGRAAKRMTELTGMEAKTIHRLIGLGINEEEMVPIEADYLILDEASMIDAYVFHNLLEMLSDNTNILIVGDHEQLPSVGPGLILRDLMNSETIETIRLTEIFRQEEDSKIVYNAHRVVIGDKDNLAFDTGSDGDFYFINRPSDFSSKNAIMQSIKNMMNNKGYTIADIQVLTMMRKGVLGTVALNDEIQRIFNPSKKGIKIGERFFKENDKVMQTENNYDLDVFNGDIGTIQSIYNDGENIDMVVDFGDKEVIYTKDNIRELTLAYATTIHKSQGSEYPVVIMPFHRSLEILTNKNMINTAWTRATDIVVCVGDKNELYKGIDKTDNMVRNSLIKEKLQNTFSTMQDAI